MTGQTDSQGAEPHCWQSIGRVAHVGLAELLAVREGAPLRAVAAISLVDVALDADPGHLPVHDTPSSPTRGMLFSMWQAATQALQPVQRSLSIVMPQRYSLSGWASKAASKGMTRRGRRCDGPRAARDARHRRESRPELIAVPLHRAPHRAASAPSRPLAGQVGQGHRGRGCGRAGCRSTGRWGCGW